MLSFWVVLILKFWALAMIKLKMGHEVKKLTIEFLSNPKFVGLVYIYIN